jgi:hypothetical protein
VISPRPTLKARKDKRASVGPAAGKTPLGNVGRQGREKPDTACLTRLRLFDVPQRNRTLDKDRAFADVLPLERERQSLSLCSVR